MAPAPTGAGAPAATAPEPAALLAWQPAVAAPGGKNKNTVAFPVAEQDGSNQAAHCDSDEPEQQIEYSAG